MRSFEICTLIDPVSSLLPFFEMSTNDFQFNRVTSYPYQFGSDPTRLHEIFWGSDPNGITFESDPVCLGTDSRFKWVRIRRVPCKRKAYSLQFGYGPIWIRSRVNGALIATEIKPKKFLRMMQGLRNLWFPLLITLVLLCDNKGPSAVCQQKSKIALTLIIYMDSVPLILYRLSQKKSIQKRGKNA